jgi:type II secretory pathway component HofQ
MKQVFIIVDKTDAKFNKPFVKICKNEQAAESQVAKMRLKVSAQAKNLISYEPVNVSDFDANKNSIYILFDKTDNGRKKPFVDMFFSLANAEAKLKELRAKVSLPAKKLIYLNNESFI